MGEFSILVLTMRYTSEHIDQLVTQAMSFIEHHSKGIVYLECDGNYDLDISLVILPSTDIEKFLVDANFYRHDLSIEITLVHNPKSPKGDYMHWINWSINEILAHEICHYHQYLEGRLPRKGKRELPPQKYFLQDHEVEAQVEGWKRVSSITGETPERCAEVWFEMNKFFHDMEEKEYQKIIKKIFEKVFFLRGE
jgi:hypothetical protein